VRAVPGFTLIEMMVAIAVIAAVILIVATRLDRWRDIEAVKSAARSVEGAFAYARGEAIRTGNHHILFIRTDIAGNPLEDAEGNRVPILILDDGRPGSADQNCQIDAGENFEVVRLERGVAFGATAASVPAPLDVGGSPFAGGSSFSDTDGNPADWVLFRPDGMPRSIDATCAVGALGSGGGGVYLSNAERDAAIVLSPLGAARVFAWNSETVQWR
jgi:prepilin-type N-terminal cleavage/methylation domain-containing protein